MKKVFVLLVLISPLCLPAQTPLDSDGDGMPNDWEVTYNLNPDDAQDAWQDQDGDLVLNLHEFQLSGNPNDSSLPNIIQITPVDDLEIALRNAPSKSVIRVATGTYFINYRLGFLDDPKQIMIQGGWNEDFTQNETCLFPVTIDGSQTDNIFNLDFTEGAIGTFILDKLNITNGEGSIIDVSGVGVETIYFSLHDCKIFENNSDWFKGSVDFSDGVDAKETMVVISNCQIIDNVGDGLKLDITSDGSTFKMYNTLVSGNKISQDDNGIPRAGIGLDLDMVTDSLAKVEFRNNIFWGNEDRDISILGSENEFTFTTSNNNYGAFDITGSFEYTPGAGDISLNPLFIDTENGNYELSAESPSKNTGLNLGFPGHEEGMVDMGPIFCPLGVSSIFTANVNYHPLNIYPTINSGQFTLDFDIPRPSEMNWVLHQLDGLFVSRGQINGQAGSNTHLIHLPNSNLPNGVYLFTMLGENKVFNAKVIIQRN